jgi:hypothetical protein
MEMAPSRRAFDRRTFLEAGLLSPLGAAAGAMGLPAGEGTARGWTAPLREKFFGCIAACHIGSSMGAAVEGWPYERIEREHGILDRLLPYEHYGNGWRREPGTTEDGVERQKLMITAIIEKGDRVAAEDVRKIWLRDFRSLSQWAILRRGRARRPQASRDRRGDLTESIVAGGTAKHPAFAAGRSQNGSLG